jgi:hypothetical protein
MAIYLEREQPSRVSDGEFSAGEIKAGQVVYQSRHHQWALLPALANDHEWKARGIALNDAGDGERVSVLVDGCMIAPNNDLTPGMIYVVSAKEPGAIVPFTELVPGDRVTLVGMALTPYDFRVNLLGFGTALEASAPSPLPVTVDELLPMPAKKSK